MRRHEQYFWRPCTVTRDVAHPKSSVISLGMVIIGGWEGGGFENYPVE
jgi:hypothetical protein